MEGIAVFDNEGRLWAEQPIYFQLAFALDRVKALAPRHPEWKECQLFEEFPPRQKAASFTIDQALAKMREAASGAGH
jgi:hypothetical protein